MDESDLQRDINNIYKRIDSRIPKISFQHFDNTTSAKKSSTVIINQKDVYCVGDSLIVQVDASDYLGKAKTYGGDFLMARIYSPDVKGSASGRIEDFGNGTYHVHFTLFWQGTVRVSVLLIHPSEGVSALWQARNKGHGYVAYTGQFLMGETKAEMKCGFDLNRTQELCEYSDLKEEEYFYCVKPENMSCASLINMMSVFIDSHSYLSDLEKTLFNRTNIRVQIPNSFGMISVSSCRGCQSYFHVAQQLAGGLDVMDRAPAQCELAQEVEAISRLITWLTPPPPGPELHSPQESHAPAGPQPLPTGPQLIFPSHLRPPSHGPRLEAAQGQMLAIMHELVVINKGIQAKINHKQKKCSPGMKHQFPSGYFYQNMWHHLSCNMSHYRSTEAMNECIKGKILHFTGDSTMLQWVTYITNTVKSLKPFNLYGVNWPMTRLFMDMERNVKVLWRKHANPFIMLVFHTYKEEFTVSHQIDEIGGNQNTIITFTLGMHFRLFPIEHFIRRAINIQRATKRLLLRSPDTKIIIKTENTTEMDIRIEMLSDFHGYLQYLIINEIFQDLNVGLVDAWDMTNAFASNNIHPPVQVVSNEVDLFLNYIC
ncbi:NXPE family member 4-like [Discoglossus pictus]